MNDSRRNQTSPGLAPDRGDAGAPTSVRVIRTLGHGRAARAQLVDATMSDGRVVQCVEKVFAPGFLTRFIYRLSFQSPFAYQTNRDAILSCFYRRRVASAALAASDIDAGIAKPLYVRYDQDFKAWVLAAEWVDGRGLKPAPADATRIRRRFKRSDDQGPSPDGTNPDTGARRDEEHQLVELMHELEAMLGRCGLVGSGWQVAPRALVSTANLLRSGDRYSIIDLESGIPAVLVPKYLVRGLTRWALPPFDDLDDTTLRDWLDSNARLLVFRIGPEAVESLRHDITLLIEHTSRWKASELALFRRPWQRFSKHGMDAYQEECIRRWHQEGVVDDATGRALDTRSLKSRLIWWSGLLPSSLGRFCSRLVGNQNYRRRFFDLLQNRQLRREHWRNSVEKFRVRLIKHGRIPNATEKLSRTSHAVHRFLQALTPRQVHRFLVDPATRRDVMTSVLLFLFSPRFQSWFGGRRIDAAIGRWNEAQRISDEEAAELRQDLRGREVLAYTRGFGMHLALKALAPVILPAKVGGIAAFLAGGSPWFLLPMILTPLLRSAVTLANAWTTRHQGVSHGEAFLTGLLPMVGSVAYPMQMFSTRPRLATFLIRDAASKVGRRLPIYGGNDSRTEIAMIRVTDFLIEVMDAFTSKLRLPLRRSELPIEQEADMLRTLPRTRLGRWIDRKAGERIRSQSEQEGNRDTSVRAAA